MTTHLLQVLPSVIRKVDGEFEIEVDFSESLRLYATNCDLVAIACPIRACMGEPGSWRCRPLRDLPFRDRLRIVPQPDAYRPVNFLRPAARDLGVADRVGFHGDVAANDEVHRVMGDSDLFVFCRQTPESPRYLVASVRSLVSCSAAYPRELVARVSGRAFARDWSMQRRIDLIREYCCAA